MIGIFKSAESAENAIVRQKHLARLRAIPKRSSKDIYGYDDEKISLWKNQYGKCCYCEQKIPYPYNDVEHYRPKAEAIRSPGSAETHGYWWLAYSWENLFYSCASCNRSSKNSLFPLAIGSSALAEENMPPGNEVPLLLYPGCNDAIHHIKFEFIEVNKYPNLSWWKAVPINASPLGDNTINVIGLNSQDRVEVRMNYFKDTLKPLIVKIKNSIEIKDEKAEGIHLTNFRDLFYANQPFSVFSYSVYMEIFPNGLKRLEFFNISFELTMLGCTLDSGYGTL